MAEIEKEKKKNFITFMINLDFLNFFLFEKPVNMTFLISWSFIHLIAFLCFLCFLNCVAMACVHYLINLLALVVSEVAMKMTLNMCFKANLQSNQRKFILESLS